MIDDYNAAQNERDGRMVINIRSCDSWHNDVYKIKKKIVNGKFLVNDLSN